MARKDNANVMECCERRLPWMAPGLVCGVFVVLSFFSAGLTDAVPQANTEASEAAPSEAAPSETAPEERPRHAIPSVDTEANPITIDGRPDEALWSQALRLTLDYETNPGNNSRVPDELRTECFLMHDETQIYVAFRAYDPEPEKVRARLNDRDNAFFDDFVGVVFDTFDAQRRAFEFFVNPLGVQMDMIFDDVNFTEDTSWNGIWTSAGRLTDFGFEVEYAIPFSNLRFPKTEGPQVWGVDALRLVPRGFRKRLAINPLGREVSCYLCQFSKLEGFEGISPGRDLEITPTITAGRTDLRNDFPNGPLESGDEDGEIGLTVNWGITPNLNLSATYEPDFSQVEADVAQLDINTPFALFFPERRPFFLEDAELFDSPVSTVFTRNVADPKWGLRLTGKQGKNALGVFVAEDERTDLIFPGSQSSSAGSFTFETIDSAVRYRRDLTARSSLGFIATSREGRGSIYSNRVYGVDGLFRFSDSDTLSIQWLESTTEYPTEIIQDFNQPEGSFEDSALQLIYDHEGANWLWTARYEDVGEDFRADLGFVPQVDTQFWLGSLQRNWWGNDEKWYSRIELDADWELTEDKTGQRLDERFQGTLRVRGPLQTLFTLGLGTRERFFNNRDFSEDFYNAYFEMIPNASIYFTLSVAGGDEIDFANTRPGEQFRLAPSIRLELGRSLRIDLSHDYRDLEVEGGKLFEANLSQLQAVYQFNRRTFIRSIFQYTDIDRTLELYDAPGSLEAKTEQLFTQLLFSYKVNARTVLFLGYSDNYRGNRAIDLTQENRALFLKVGYAWVL